MREGFVTETGLLHLFQRCTNDRCCVRLRVSSGSETCKARPSSIFESQAIFEPHSAELRGFLPRIRRPTFAVMSHELRTPLNAIGGYAELIELGIHGAVTDAQRTALARIQASQRHLLGLIAGVLDYSRVEAGAVRYKLENVPVAEAVS